MNNKDLIIMTLKKMMLEALKQDKEEYGITTEELASTINLNRTYVSHQLNMYNRENKVVKINTRPVFYLDKEGMQDFFGVDLGEKAIYKSFKELNNKIEKHKHCESISDQNKNVFGEMIGYNGSLEYQIEQCKAAVKYPPNGLSVLITGPTGSGKSLLASNVYEYARAGGYIDKEAPFIVFNCAKYFNNKELLSASIFGYKKGAFTGAEEDREGIIEKANGGFVFLDEIHRLPPEGQELLFFFMDKGLFTRVGENEKYRHSDVRFVFATTEKPECVLLNTFMRRIPIIIRMLPLNERPLTEKHKLIYSFLKEESKLLNCELKVSKHVLKVFLDNDFSGNIGQLKNSIKLTCARAYSNYSNNNDPEDEVIKVDLMSLPEYLMQGVYSKRINYVEGFIKGNMLDDISVSNNSTKHIGSGFDHLEIGMYKEFCESLLKLFSCIKDNNEDKIFEEIQNLIDDYFGKLVLNLKSFGKEDVRHVRFNVFYKCVQDIFYFLKDKYDIKYYDNDIYRLTCFIQRSVENYYGFLVLEDYESKIVKNLNFFKKHYTHEYELSCKIVQLLESNLDLSLGRLEMMIIMLYMLNINKEELPQRTKAIILAHGYSTASSIANVTNHLLNSNIFESFDMPVETDTENIIKRIKQYLQEVNVSKGIMILVDMGSLEEIYKGLEGGLCGTIGIVNNVTTKLALEIGNGIIKELEVEEIIRNVQKLEGYKCKTIVPSTVKKQAIIVTCLTGIGTAIKIKDLLSKSLSLYTQNIKIIPYSFEKLSKEKNNNNIFNQYDVKAIIGTNNPNITDIPFIFVEDLISSSDKCDFEWVLNSIVPADKIAEVRQSLLKYFTLESVLSYITILNPDKLIDQLEISIETLQYELNYKFTDDLKICLYIHLSCLIERLVTKTHADETDIQKLNAFKRNNHKFISIIRKSFSLIENYYSVKIPVSEIIYIYEILSEKLEVNAVGNNLFRSAII